MERVTTCLYAAPSSAETPKLRMEGVMERAIIRAMSLRNTCRLPLGGTSTHENVDEHPRPHTPHECSQTLVKSDTSRPSTRWRT